MSWPDRRTSNRPSQTRMTISIRSARHKGFLRRRPTKALRWRWPRQANGDPVTLSLAFWDTLSLWRSRTSRAFGEIPPVQRLDVTTPYESVIRAVYYSLLMGTAVAICGATYLFLSGSQEAQGLVALALCAPLMLAAGWAGSLIDDTYWVDCQRRLLFFQKRRLRGIRLNVVKSFDELAAVSVDYAFESPPWAWHDLIGRRRGPCHMYALALVGRDGKVIRVSDPREDGYSVVSQQAAALSALTGIPLLDEGPERAPVASGGYLRHQDQGQISSDYALLGLLLFVLSLVLRATGFVP